MMNRGSSESDDRGPTLLSPLLYTTYGCFHEITQCQFVHALIHFFHAALHALPCVLHVPLHRPNQAPGVVSSRVVVYEVM